MIECKRVGIEMGQIPGPLVSGSVAPASPLNNRCRSTISSQLYLVKGFSSGAGRVLILEGWNSGEKPLSFTTVGVVKTSREPNMRQFSQVQVAFLSCERVLRYIQSPGISFKCMLPEKEGSGFGLYYF